MHILLTRPFDDCSELMLRFKSLGHLVSHIPVIRIEKINYESLDFSLFKGIIFTSTNAIKFLDTQKIDKKIKCFCVGNATEKVAKIKGFQNIYVCLLYTLNWYSSKNFGDCNFLSYLKNLAHYFVNKHKLSQVFEL